MRLNICPWAESEIVRPWWIDHVIRKWMYHHNDTAAPLRQWFYYGKGELSGGREYDQGITYDGGKI